MNCEKLHEHENENERLKKIMQDTHPTESFNS